jgi:cobalt-zinc-cadmium efflux system outer membrane protein
MVFFYSEPRKLFFSCLITLVVALLLDLSAKEPQDINRIDIDNPYLLDSLGDDIETGMADWSLDRIEKYATSNNPLYLAEKQNISIVRGDVITAALYRNPIFNYQAQFIPLNGARSIYNPFLGYSNSGGPPEFAPSVTQDFDVGGVIEQRTQVAKKAFLAQIASFQDFDRLFRLRLRQNYWLYLYVTELINFQKEFYLNYNDLLKLNKFRAEKGDISPLEYDRLILERIRIEKEYKDSEILRAQVAKDLRFLIGISPKNQILVLNGKLKFFSTKDLGLNFLDFNIEDRPDLKSLQLNVAKNRLNIELKKKEGGLAPFLNLGGEVRHKGNETYAGMFATIPLKVFDRNQGEIVKAEEQYKKSVLELESKRKQIYAEIRAAVRELNAREELLSSYETINLMDKNKEVQGKFRTAYIRGASNLVTFLEAEKNYITVLKGYYEQLYLYYNAIESYKASIGKLGNLDE